VSSGQKCCAAVVAALLVLLVAGAPARAAHVGGTLQVLSGGDVDYLDPGSTYYSFGYEIAGATQRTLYAFRPDGGLAPVPDLADGPPEISADARTITVHLRSGVRFAPPVNREVVAGDVKYALERAFSGPVGNGYVHQYFGDLVGAPAGYGAVRAIPGIETPDPHTLVLRLTRPTGYLVAAALTLPATAPVPPAVARPLDKGLYSKYEQHVVASGPYMVTSHVPGAKLVLSRNPNWNPATDFRPAYADSIVVWEGNATRAALRRVLYGSGLLSANLPSDPKLVAAAPAGQVARAGALGTRYIALNTTVWPFGRAGVRRAVAAATDRAALLAARQVQTPGTLATHFLPPGIPGFDEAGGAAGPRLDFLAHPHGDLALARSYMRHAGYPSGRYRGRRTISLVATNNDIGYAMSRIVGRALARLGFRVRARHVYQDEVYSRWCDVPARRIGVCASVGWFADFGDPETVLGPTFSGRSISAFGNVNWPQLDDRGINAAMDRAALVPPGPARDVAWGAIDRDVTALAPAIPYEWDVTTELHSADVDAALNPVDAGWDLSFSGLR
jgi:peptide/nickel transport system substrate-binding protein